MIFNLFKSNFKFHFFKIIYYYVLVVQKPCYIIYTYLLSNMMMVCKIRNSLRFFSSTDVNKLYTLKI